MAGSHWSVELNSAVSELNQIELQIIALIASAAISLDSLAGQIDARIYSPRTDRLLNILRLHEGEQTSLSILRYELLSRLFPADILPYMNHGYLGEDFKPGYDLKRGDFEDWPESISLYLKVLSNVELNNRRVLEFGCGRGRGAILLSERFNPSLWHGIDRCYGHILMARQQLPAHSAVSFGLESVDKIIDKGMRFDVFISVESVHEQKELEIFWSKIALLLNPCGVVAIGDAVRSGDLRRIRAIPKKAGFREERWEDITSGVRKGLDSLIVNRLPAALKQLQPEKWLVFEKTLAERFRGREINYRKKLVRYYSALYTKPPDEAA